MNRQRMLSVLGVLAGCWLLCADDASANFKMSDAGTTTGQFLKLGVGARAIGMGEAYSAVANEPTAIYWNPAGLATVSEHMVQMMHAVWFESIYYDFFSYAQPVGPWCVMGMGVQYLSAGEIDELDAAGSWTGTFSPTDLAVSFAWAEDFEDLLVGASVKLIMMEITSTAQAIAGDIGIMYPLLIDRVMVGFSMQNIGGTARFDTAAEGLPVNARLGVAVRAREQWIISCDINTPIDYNPYACVGTEYMLGQYADVSMSLRAGYSTHMSKSELDGISGLAGGVGFRLWDAGVDYAWVPYGDLGQTHRVSLSYAF